MPPGLNDLTYSFDDTLPSPSHFWCFNGQAAVALSIDNTQASLPVLAKSSVEDARRRRKAGLQIPRPAAHVAQMLMDWAYGRDAS